MLDGNNSIHLNEFVLRIHGDNKHKAQHNAWQSLRKRTSIFDFYRSVTNYHSYGSLQYLQ